MYKGFSYCIVYDVYKKHIVYYEVKKTISPLKVQPKLFRSTLYGIRSNISEPTICSAAYDTLVGVFQDHAKHDVLNIEFQERKYYHEHNSISLI